MFIIRNQFIHHVSSSVDIYFPSRWPTTLLGAGKSWRFGSCQPLPRPFPFFLKKHATFVVRVVMIIESLLHKIDLQKVFQLGPQLHCSLLDQIVWIKNRGCWQLSGSKLTFIRLDGTRSHFQICPSALEALAVYFLNYVRLSMMSYRWDECWVLIVQFVYDLTQKPEH